MKPSPFLFAISALIASINHSSAWSDPIETPSSTPLIPSNITIDAALQSLEKYAALQKSLGIQNGDLAYAMRKALVIADLLVKTDGSLALDLCPAIETAFFSTDPTEYEVHMIEFLHLLNSSWESILGKIHASKNPTGLDNLVLRALFSLDPDQSVTSRHAKVAVLAALLAPYNENSADNCVAVSEVLRNHEEHAQSAAADYTSIVTKGFIDRLIEGKMDSFFFLPILSDSDRTTLIQLCLDGTFPNSKTTLLDAPGFAAALALMGGTKTAGLQEKTVQLIFGSITEPVIQATPTQIIGAMAQVIGEEQNKDPGALRILGEYGFSSLTQNPVLRAVESAIAAMAENRPSDSTRSSINVCVTQALQTTWQNLSGVDGILQFQKKFLRVLNASYRLIYNFNISLGKELDSGFQMYRRVPGDVHEQGIRIATPKQFQQLVLDAVDATEKAFNFLNTASVISDQLRSAINSDEFLKNAFWAYDPENLSHSDPVLSYKELFRTPMQTCDRDGSFEKNDLETGALYHNQVQTYQPQDPQDLIRWCLGLAKKTFAEMLPMNNHQHAFNFVPKNPDIVAFLTQNISPSKWLKHMLIIPGMQVSNKTIDRSTQKAIADAFYEKLEGHGLDAGVYQGLVENLAAKSISLQTFASSLLNKVTELLNLPQDRAHELALVFDGILLHNLSPNDQSILNRAAIRFASTNWSEGTKNVYFCAYFNPRTLQVGFGRILEDKTNLQPLDEQDWVNQMQWEVDLQSLASKEA